MKRALLSEVLFAFTLISQLSFGQLNYLDSDQSEPNSKLRFSLQGDWYLSETELVAGYGFEKDSNRFYTDDHKSRKIVFSKDSITVHPDNTKRYYTGYTRNYLFKVEYDSLFRQNDIKLFEGRKRKQRELDSYEVVKCTRDELVLKSVQYINSSIDLVNFSIFYTYRREGVDSLLTSLKGEWHHCSEGFRSIWSNLDDSTSLRLTRISDTTCSEYANRLTIGFGRNRNENEFSFSEFSSVVGIWGESPFEVDPNEGLLYFGRNEIMVYNIVALNENELILTLDKARTESLQKSTGTD